MSYKGVRHTQRHNKNRSPLLQPSPIFPCHGKGKDPLRSYKTLLVCEASGEPRRNETFVTRLKQNKCVDPHDPHRQADKQTQTLTFASFGFPLLLHCLTPTGKPMYTRRS